MASSVQKIKLWDTFKNAKSVILHFFPVAEIGRNIHLLYFSYPQQIYSQFVEWGKKVLSPYSPQWSVYFPVLLLLITRKHPVYIYVCRCADSHLSRYTWDMDVLVLVGLRTCRGDLGTGGGLVSFLTAWTRGYVESGVTKHEGFLWQWRHIYISILSM